MIDQIILFHKGSVSVVVKEDELNLKISQNNETIQAKIKKIAEDKYRATVLVNNQVVAYTNIDDVYFSSFKELLAQLNPDDISNALGILKTLLDIIISDYEREREDVYLNENALKLYNMFS